MSPFYMNPEIELMGDLAAWFPQALQYTVDMAHTLTYQGEALIQTVLSSARGFVSHHNPVNNFLHSRRRRNSNQDVPLLQLPPDTILDIAEFLGPDGVIPLSQSCKALHRLLHNYSKSLRGRTDPATMDEEERMRLLLSIGSRRLDMWCCQFCKCLHPAVAQDVPGAALLWPIQNNQSSTCRDDDIMASIHYHAVFTTARRKFVFRHHHMQLALKYQKRMDLEDEIRNDPHKRRVWMLIKTNTHGTPDLADFHRHYLARLLSPFYGRLSLYRPGTSTVYGVWCQVRPRVIRQPDDTYRFQMLSIYPATPEKGASFLPLFLHGGYSFAVFLCPHQDLIYTDHRTSHLGSLSMNRAGRRVHNGAEPVSKSFAPAYNMQYHNVMVVYNTNGVRLAIPEVKEKMCTSCMHCSTDIVFWNNHWYVYQDFGNEYTSPFDLEWQAHSHMEHIRSGRNPIFRDAGSIQTMYDQSVSTTENSTPN